MDSSLAVPGKVWQQPTNGHGLRMALDPIHSNAWGCHIRETFLSKDLNTNQINEIKIGHLPGLCAGKHWRLRKSCNSCTTNSSTKMYGQYLRSSTGTIFISGHHMTQHLTNVHVHVYVILEACWLSSANLNISGMLSTAFFSQEQSCLITA